MRKCPVCEKDYRKGRVCPQCGFDSSCDYERYPTVFDVSGRKSVQILREEWKRKQEPEHAETEQPRNDLGCASLSGDRDDLYDDVQVGTETDVLESAPEPAETVTEHVPQADNAASNTGGESIFGVLYSLGFVAVIVLSMNDLKLGSIWTLVLVFGSIGFGYWVLSATRSWFDDLCMLLLSGIAVFVSEKLTYGKPGTWYALADLGALFLSGLISRIVFGLKKKHKQK